MTTPIKKTNATQSTKTSNHTSNSARARKNDSQIQSVFTELDKNNKQAIKEHEQFMQDMFGDNVSGKTNSSTSQQAQQPKKRVNKRLQKVNNEINNNHKQADKEHDQFMQDMFGDVL